MSPSCLTPFSFPFLPGSNLWRSVSWRSPRRPSSSCLPPRPGRCSACWRSSASACPRRFENPKQGLSNFLAFRVFDFSSQEHFLSQHCQMRSFPRSCLSPKCHIPWEKQVKLNTLSHTTYLVGEVCETLVSEIKE